ncbi:MAG: O-methyltransferase [Cyclobacteriaceae bacterium]|nr:O-methyltransferase [Cyclobacteriaceae bacterium]
MERLLYHFFICSIFLHISFLPLQIQGQDLDSKVASFLKKNKSQWKDLNVPYEDGQTLFDLIVEHKYTSALEIGTSTGHSTIWMAWAMSKTGGKVITIEINEKRYREALKNFKEAGLSDFIDARLADAMELIPKLVGPFDFVFSDADKGNYKNYFELLHPKLKKGGIFSAHNVREGYYGVDDFLQTIKNHPDYETTFDTKTRAGISLSKKID